MKIYKSNRLAIPLLIFSVLVIVSLACSITIPTPAPSTAIPAPTDLIVIPDDITVWADRPLDLLWVGGNQAGNAIGNAITFCVHLNQVDMIHLVVEIHCQDKQTGENYSHWAAISLNVPFLLDAQGNFNGGYQLPDGAYEGTNVDVDGYLRGSHGNVQILLYSENDVARCESEAISIDVQETTSPCVR